MGLFQGNLARILAMKAGRNVNPKFQAIKEKPLSLSDAKASNNSLESDD